MQYGTVGMGWGLRQAQATMYGCIGCVLHECQPEGEQGPQTPLPIAYTVMDTTVFI